MAVERGMQLEFLGATGTVTGSKYLIAAARSPVLGDCGLFQGYRQLRWDVAMPESRTP